MFKLYHPEKEQKEKELASAEKSVYIQKPNTADTQKQHEKVYP